MQCWYSYLYRNDRYVFGQGDMTCLRSSKIPLIPSKTKYPLGKHPNNLMPKKHPYSCSRYGIGAPKIIADEHYETTHLRNGKRSQNTAPNQNTYRYVIPGHTIYGTTPSGHTSCRGNKRGPQQASTATQMGQPRTRQILPRCHRCHR